jgi:hypothetical protein
MFSVPYGMDGIDAVIFVAPTHAEERKQCSNGYGQAAYDATYNGSDWR